MCKMMYNCDVTSFPLRTFRESLRALLGDRSFEPGTGAIHCILDEHTVTHDRDQREKHIAMNKARNF